MVRNWRREGHEQSHKLQNIRQWDGVSYKLLSKMWEFLKTPLTKMANEGLVEGVLSPTLRTGLIKLIPKGKNNSKI